MIDKQNFNGNYLDRSVPSFFCMTLYSVGSKAYNDVFKIIEVQTTELIVAMPLHLNLFCC